MTLYSDCINALFGRSFLSKTGTEQFRGASFVVS